MIAIIIGTRAELIKMAPVMKELKSRGIPYKYVHTGQHNVEDLVKELNVRSPDILVTKPVSMRGNFEHSSNALIWNLKVLLKLKRILLGLKPSIVLVHGDTMTTTTATVAAKLGGLKVGHVEAGLRSGNLFEPWPEELSRRITDYLSTYLFAPTQDAANNLIDRNIFGKKNIFVTGNTNVDVLKENLKCVKKIKVKPYIFAKLHRQENIKNKKRMETFLKLLNSFDVPVEFVVVENTRKRIKRYNLNSYLENSKNIRLHGILSYRTFLNMFANASLIISDGGGEIEEATYLNIPIISFRKYSERKEADKVGLGISTVSYETAIEYAKKVLFDKIKVKISCPFGEGDAAKRIVDTLVRI